MKNNIQSVGIIGLGAFGRLCSSLVPEGVTVLGFDTKPPANYKTSTLEDVCATDAVILAVPLSAYPEVLTQIQPLLTKSTLLIDICSVKVKPLQLLQKHLPDHTNILLTHPLFGPQTVENGTKGLTLVVCSEVSEMSEPFITFCSDVLKLTIVRLSPAQHDKEMALVHALTMFLARGLSDIHAEESQFATPSFTYLKKLIELDRVHTEELFQTIENGNPYAQNIRTQLITQLEKIDSSLKN